MDADTMAIRAGFAGIEESLDNVLHELHSRLARMDVLAAPTVEPDTSEVTVALALPRAVDLPVWRYDPAPVPVQPDAVELWADMPRWRRWLRQLDRWIGNQIGEAA